MNGQTPDVVIIGAGAIGCSIAWELARRGADVWVLERDAPGREATWAAAGILSPAGPAGQSAAMHELCERSLDLWADFAEGLRASTQVDVEYVTSGALHVAFDEDNAIDVLIRRGTAFGVQPLTPERALEIEPLLSPDVRAAAFVPRDHRVDNRRLSVALWSACVGAGVTFRTGDGAEAIVGANGRFAAVRTLRGGMIAARAVIVAAGAWSARLEGLPRRLDVRPVRGQMLALDTSDGARLRHVVHGDDCYLVPRGNGLLLVGATIEEAGFQPGPTPDGIASLSAAATRLVPATAELRIVETWAGFRPGTPDGLPILGRDPEVDGVYYATGHYRNGILLTPVTAQLLADVVSGIAPALSLEPFSVARFDEAHGQVEPGMRWKTTDRPGNPE